MSTIHVPLQGAAVNQSGESTTGAFVNGRWQPGSPRLGRASLHDVHLRPTAAPVEEAPQPLEIPTQPHQYAPQPAAADFTQGDTMAANHSEQDNEYFDPYDREQLNALVEKRVQAALQPSRQQKSDAELVE